MSNVVSFSHVPQALRLNRQGAIKDDLANAMIVCRSYMFIRTNVFFDEFKRRPMVNGMTPWSNDAGLRPWSDYDTARLTEYMQIQEMPFKYTTVETALLTVCEEQKRNPLRDWLSGLKWDGKRRVPSWLQVYFGCKSIPFIHAAGSAWLISAVARVLKPGCKVDHMLVLEGPQGLGKSTALRIMAGDSYFTDELPDLNSKDAPLQLLGSWIIEMAELDALSRVETSRIKAFITSSVDKYRPPYGRTTIDVPRASVFAGTVNNYDYLKDSSNRRFWPVRCEYVDEEGLRSDREQLWAEAAHMYGRGDAWWIQSDEVKEEAAQEQALRRATDAWEPTVLEYLAGVDDFSIPELLSNALGLPRDRWDRAAQTRVGCVVSGLIGWRRYRTTGVIREWRYRRL